MVMCLAFSVAINMDPEVLWVDEVFGSRRRGFPGEVLRARASVPLVGKTLMCVSHATGMVQAMCNRATWLDHDELMMAGRIGEVIEAYEDYKSAAPSA
jgi:ABC-type polysaccharide/polyol phosphate transport system ATPase subunit